MFRKSLSMAHAGKDLLASIVVFLVALPLCMDLIETIRAQRLGTAGELDLDPRRLRLRYHRSQLRGATPPVAILPRSATRSAVGDGTHPHHRRRASDFGR